MVTRSRLLVFLACMTALLVAGVRLPASAAGGRGEAARAVARHIDFDAGNGMRISGYVALSQGLQTADGCAAPVRVLAHHLVLYLDGSPKAGFSGVPLVSASGRDPHDRNGFQLAGAPGGTPIPGADSFHIRLIIKPRALLTWGEVVSPDDLLVETICTRNIGTTVPRLP